MKRIKAITGILVLALLLFCGCGNQPEDTTTSTMETTTSTMETTTSTMETTTSTQETTTTQGSGVGPSAYDGFMKPEVGNWVEYEQEGAEESFKQKIEVVREENYEGTACKVLEMDIQSKGIIVQMWLSKDSRDIKRYVMKQSDNVFCVDNTEFSKDVPEGTTEKGTPDKYSPDQPDISYGTYTTDAGTTVKVAKFQTEEGETWVSSEVPFGIVKHASTDGTMRVSEFGLTGARGDITQSEIANCQGMQTSP